MSPWQPLVEKDLPIVLCLIELSYSCLPRFLILVTNPHSLFLVYYGSVKPVVVDPTDKGVEAVPNHLVVWQADFVVYFNLAVLLPKAEDEYSGRVVKP